MAETMLKEIDSLLTVHDVARYMGVADNTVYRWERDHKLESVRILGAVRFKPAVVEAFKKARRG